MKINLALVALVAILSGATVVAQTAEPAKLTVERASKELKIISEDEAKAIAEKRVPGKAVDVAIEKKRGANRYVVEVRPSAGGAEQDVIIDMSSGKVLAVEK